jgi:hypothetical protein
MSVDVYATHPLSKNFDESDVGEMASGELKQEH